MATIKSTNNTLFSISVLLISFCLSLTAFAQNKNLPLPSFPANFEVAEYQGQKGCLPNNYKYIAAVGENAGTSLLGGQITLQSPLHGRYHTEIHYNKNADFGYILADKQNGKLCVIDKISGFSKQQVGAFKQIAFEGTITTKQCAAIPYRFDGICGNFKELSAKLISKGFRLEWQAKRADGDILTLLSGNNKTYVLTTDSKSNATVLTEVSTVKEFDWIEDVYPVK